MTDITREDLLIALANSSFVRLDALGVSTDMRTPAVDVNDNISRALYGRGRFGRLWAQRVFPRLFPEQHRALRAAHEMAIAQVQREWTAAMTDRLQAVIDDLTHGQEK